MWANGCVSTYASMPFGGGLTPSGNCTDPTEHHFTGKEHDAETGNDYFAARYYSSTMGRWMSPDWSVNQEPVPYAKLDNPQSLNLYSYVYDNPLSRADPDGHCGDPISCALDIAGVAMDVYAVAKNPSAGNIAMLAIDTVLTIAPVPGLMNSGALKIGAKIVEAVHDGEEVAHAVGEGAHVAEETGVVYKRTNPMTGEEYIGQSKSGDRYAARQGEHDTAHGVKHDYEVLERGKPGQDLNVKEESHLRNGGGPKNQGGTLANK